jgi:hypothetical protein
MEQLLDDVFLAPDVEVGMEECSLEPELKGRWNWHGLRGV